MAADTDSYQELLAFLNSEVIPDNDEFRKFSNKMVAMLKEFRIFQILFDYKFVQAMTDLQVKNPGCFTNVLNIHDLLKNMIQLICREYKKAIAPIPEPENAKRNPIPKCPSVFGLYRRDHRLELDNLFPKLKISTKDRCALANDFWKALAPNERRFYEEKHKNVKEEYYVKYPEKRPAKRRRLQ